MRATFVLHCVKMFFSLLSLLIASISFLSLPMFVSGGKIKLSGLPLYVPNSTTITSYHGQTSQYSAISILSYFLSDSLPQNQTKLTPPNRLATFFPEESYLGFSFPITGFYDSCYNYHGHVESITLGQITQYCDLFSEPDCGEGKSHFSPFPSFPLKLYRDPYAPLRPMKIGTPPQQKYTERAKNIYIFWLTAETDENGLVSSDVPYIQISSPTPRLSTETDEEIGFGSVRSVRCFLDAAMEKELKDGLK